VAKKSAEARCDENVVRRRAVLRMQELAMQFPELRKPPGEATQQALARFAWFMSSQSLATLVRDCPGLVEPSAQHARLWGIDIVVVDALPADSVLLGVG
jgi:hypothetical protein